jgi:uncharacterized membrane protein (DUF373 family)
MRRLPGPARRLTVYLRHETIHIEIVLATAFMAIAREVIVLDHETTPSEYVWATAAVVLAMSLGYFLVVIRGGQAGAGADDVTTEA